MDEFKPEDELRPDPDDRRSGRYRKPIDQDNEPQLNIDDVDFDDEDDGRPSRARQDRQRDEAPELYQAEDDDELHSDEAAVHRPQKHRRATPPKPASRQHIMMGIGILVLLLLVIGVGSALKSPAGHNTASADNNGAEKSINLASNTSGANGDINQSGGAQSTLPVITDNSQMAGQNTSTDNQNQVQPGAQNSSGQDISLPPVSSTPTQSPDMANANPEPQRRVELQGDLGSALSGQQNAVAVNTVAGSTLPTQPATVAPVNVRDESNVPAHREPAARREPARTASRETTPARKAPVERTTERQTVKAVPTVPKMTETKASATKTVDQKAVTPKHSESAATVASKVTVPTEKIAAKPTVQVPTAAPAPSTAAASATGAGNIGNVGALQAAPGSGYTLQLSSSSNFSNLSTWAKKENLQNYVVYQTKRNGQPWYVLVSGVYGSKDEAKRAVASLPAGVQAKNPWTKPIHQVQADLKQ